MRVLKITALYWPMADPRAASCLSLSLGNDGLHHHRRCHRCHHHRLSLSLCSSPAPASAPPLPYSCPAPCKLLSCSSPVPAQLLPSFFPALLHYSQLCSCSAPALFLPCSCPAPGPAHPSLAAFIIIISTLQLFSARRQPPFMLLHGKVTSPCPINWTKRL